MVEESVYLDVLTAARLKVVAANVAPPAQVVVRMRPAFFKQHDEIPLVILSPDAEYIDPADHQFGDTVFVSYPVNVTLVAGENQLVVQGNLDWVLAARQTIRRALHRPTLNGVAEEVFDVKSYDPSPAFDTRALDQLFEVSMQRFVFLASEARQS